MVSESGNGGAMTEPILLFSYGTLQDPAVQQALFGRRVDTAVDRLRGFTLESVVITDPAVIEASGSDRHPMLRRGDRTDEVAGSALMLKPAELAIADRYEAENYVRTLVTLTSGRSAYVYVHKNDSPPSCEQVEIGRPDSKQLQQLLPVARRIFRETFAQQFEPEAFESFLEEVYRPGGAMSREFDRPDVHWRVATCGGEPIGYAKLTPLRAPAKGAAVGAMELQQIYVSAEWQGRGIADRLMEWSIEAAQRADAPELYLTVFDHNHRAKRFYARHGFSEVGRCTFELGGQVYDDRIWCRCLTR
jgi:GNAT superfamily N-acetyltransferase